MNESHHISRGKVFLILLILAIVVAAVALVGYLPRKARERSAEAAAKKEKNTLPSVTAAKVHRSSSDTVLSLPGTLSPLTEASLYARAAGYLRRRFVDIGDHVREGQLIAIIDAPELDQQVSQARAAVSQAQQQLAQTRAAMIQTESQRDLAKVTAERYNNLLAKGAVARQDADTQQSNYKSAEAMVSAQQSTIGASEENVRQAQANLQRVIDLQAFKNVRAPFTGIVTARNVDTGALISATGTGAEMFRLAQIGTIRILISVPQTNAADIRVGMPADIVVNEFPNRKFGGKVARTASSLDPNSRTMPVEVQVPNNDGKLLPGMYAQVQFHFHRDAPPLLVPGDTLIATNRGLEVAILEDCQQGAKKIHLQTVVTGRDYGTETEVTSGLDGTETLVVNPGDEVHEGALVKIQ